VDGAVASRASALRAGVCPPGLNVIEGTEWTDVLIGTSADNCIVAYGGDDYIGSRSTRRPA